MSPMQRKDERPPAGWRRTAVPVLLLLLVGLTACGTTPDGSKALAQDFAKGVQTFSQRFEDTRCNVVMTETKTRDDFLRAYRSQGVKRQRDSFVDAAAYLHKALTAAEQQPGVFTGTYIGDKKITVVILKC